MGSKPLPVENAFLVQLGEEVDPQLETFTGRLEHVETGLRARFGSRDELFAQLARMLAERSSARNSKPKHEDT
jgi:hypothetical protein